MSLKRSIKKGVFYTGVSKYLGVLLTISIGVILARLLRPQDFGIVAIVTVFVTFFNNLGSMGLGMAVIQNQNLDKNDVKHIFTLSLIIGLGLAISFFLLSGIIADFYNTNELITVIRVLSIAVFFFSIQIVPKAISQKALLFKKIGIITVVVQLTTGIIAIFLAYNGWKYYSLVIKSVLDAFFSFILFYYFAPIKIIFPLKKDPLLKISRFSAFQFSFNFINYFSRNSDNFLIGKFLGTSTLGFYDMAYRLMMMPVQNLTHVITPVLLPVLSEIQDNRKLVYSSYLKVVRLLAIIGFPLSVFLYFSAEDIIFIMYGNQWDNSIPVFKILALTIGIQMILSSSGSIFQVLDRTDLLFYSGLLSAIIMVSGILYGVFIGGTLESIGFGLLVAFNFNFFQSFYLLINKALKMNFLYFLKSFLIPILLAILIGITLFFINKIGISSHFVSLLLNSVVLVLFMYLGIYFNSDTKLLLRNILKR